jgi:hypothetical protein
MKTGKSKDINAESRSGQGEEELDDRKTRAHDISEPVKGLTRT